MSGLDLVWTSSRSELMLFIRILVSWGRSAVSVTRLDIERVHHFTEALI